MKTTTILVAALALPLLAASTACEEQKYDKILAEKEAAPALPLPSVTASPVASAAPAPAFKKRNAADCKKGVVDFAGDAAFEAEVRRKLGKDGGTISPADLATIKSINLSQAKISQLDPCIFPMLTSLKDLFLGPGDYDDLTPIQKLTNIESLRISLSHVKDLHAIEGLKKMDRLDISHTLVGDEELKSVGSLTNTTELMLDEDNVSDLTPVANLKKLERLSLKKTMVKTLAPLANLTSLKFVYIADSTVSDISAVQPLMSRGMKLIQN